MSHVFPRHSNTSVPVAVGGKGCFITDSEGRQYLDACGGAAVSCLGHGHPKIIEAISEQAGKLAYAHTGFFSSEPAEALADWLVERAPAGIERVYFVSGGSEAVEASIKLARQFHLERAEPQRANIIARRQSYHGNTLGALATGGNAQRRLPYQPLLSNAMHHISPCFYWRESRPDETPEDYARRAADELEAKILELGQDTVAAFIAEPVVGATLGAVVAEQNYFKRIREICDRYGVLLILDEVMCGMGRTGHLFACEAEPVRPDILCIAKGLGAGYQPIGAMLCSARIYEAIANGSGAFQHGHTYLGHPIACATALAVVREIESADLLTQVRRRGEQLMSQLAERFDRHPHVGNIRGRGLFVGVELVGDRRTNSPLPRQAMVHAQVKRRARENGLLCYPSGGTVDGIAGDHILLAPPYIISESELALLVDRLELSLDQVLASVDLGHQAAA